MSPIKQTKEMIESHVRKSLGRLIDECKNLKHLKQIHAHILVSPNLPIHQHYFLITRLLFITTTVFSSNDSYHYAINIFNHIEKPNPFVYNTMIRAHSGNIHSGVGNSCMILYKEMLENGIKPDYLTYPFLIKGCTNQVDDRMGRIVHGHVFKNGFTIDLFVQNSVINFYSKFEDLGNAVKVFDEMLHRDIVSWNSLLSGYLRCGDLESALGVFRVMEERSVFSWNSIITGFVQGGRAIEALEFFHEMQVLGEDRVSPDEVTIASVISACASIGALDQGKWVHSYLKRSGLESDIVIRTALVDMYGKCGCLENAVAIFREMGEKDVLAWTAMISVFALYGLGNEAFDLFEEMKMEGVKPNNVTFVGLLSACAHSGLVEKGRWCFEIMREVYFIKPQVQHYACMVDLLGRAALFEEAEDIIRSMPMEPDVYVWGALLGSCRMHGNVELGERVSSYLIKMEPQNHAFYVVLSDIYAKAHRFDDVKRIRVAMEERGIKKIVPGCSKIEIDGSIHEFSVRGCPVTMMKEIEMVLTGVMTGEI
ncbi:pentatricopeptide repeat-containing protein At2g20540-like [Papaver somniferum]|uniref:pentatricopeptide repeat-containing protein At2g20540-like n=1 Tax=Papaver somniferum TaxID=3469 RepID=UPI000E6F5787|nr:pentatricopeptide repeat-containing protein At2g20540-like [Papaver somniferum]